MSKLNYFIELKEYFRFQLQQILGYNDEQFDVFEKLMLEKSIIKKDSHNVIKFTFVGFIYFEEELFFVLPKYMEQTNASVDLNKIRQIVQLFFKYSQNKNDLTKQEIETFGDLQDEKLSNIFVLADFFMLDYAQNGLYTNDKTFRNINGNGEINWYETLEELDMFLMDDSPFYPEYYTTEPLIDEDHIIHQIHQGILNEVSAFLTKFEILNIFNYELLHFDIMLDEIGDTDHLLYCIEREMQVEFSDRKIHLLKALKSYLINKEFELTRNEYKLFGTRTFHVLWEKVCSQVFANQYEEFKEFIPKPVWTELATGQSAEEATLIPDILVHNEEQKAFFILDAKYYLTHFTKSDTNRFEVKHNPGIGDVTKQYLYEQTLRKKNDIVKESECYNIFLLPTEEKSNFFGHASIDIFDDEFKGIYLYRQNAEDLYDSYLKNHHLTTNTFKKYIDEYRKKK